MDHGVVGKKKKNSSPPTPPDGGWGWVVVFASFMIHVIADGVAYTFGLFFVEVTEDWGASKSSTSWIASIMAGMTYGSGPLAGALVNKWGCRPVSIAGSFLAAIGFGISYFAQSVTYLYLSIGLIGGTGLGLIYLPAIVSVTCYFEERRAFATGIAVCGSGFGTFVLAPLISKLIQEYQWRGALLITSGILFHCTIFSALFRPLPEVSEEEDEKNKIVPSIMEPKQGGSAESIFRAIPNPDAVESNEPLLASPVNKNSGVLAPRLLTTPGDTLTMSASHPVLPVSLGSIDSIYKAASGRRSGRQERHSLKPIFGSDVLYEGSSSPRHRQQMAYNSPSGGLIMSRKDIFYSGSVLHLSPSTSKINAKSEEIEESGRRKCCGLCHCPPEVEGALETMTDFSILKNPVFLFFAFSNFFTSIGYNVPYIYLVDMALADKGNDKTSAGFLISIVGISNTVSRVILGYLSDKPWVNRLYLYNSALTICGIATGLSSHTTDIGWLRAYSATFGITVGVYVSLTSVILVDLLGLEKLTNAFGLLLLFQGVATVVGPPIVGKLFDEFSDYRYGFWLAGGMIALSGLMLFLIPLIEKKTKASHSSTCKSSNALLNSQQNPPEINIGDKMKRRSNNNLV